MEALEALLAEKVLSLRTALDAAWRAGYNEADSTYEARKTERASALQLAALKDKS